GLAFATWQRNEVYFDEIAFWHDTAEKAPHNARAFANLGHALALACRASDAERALSLAFELDPNATQPVINLALLRAGTLPGLPARCAAPPVATPPVDTPAVDTPAVDTPAVDTPPVVTPPEPPNPAPQ
ncbi:MAG TPA: hypothetical protein VEN28_01540, partial [Burkholderiaceae bacterium]|nr:hypothetical protein [Burkholderiaceae bacterium]